MNRKYVDIIFAFIIFSLPFKYIPQVLWQTILGGPFGQDLVIYPLLIGGVYTAYCQWKYKNVVYKWSIFRKFIIAYLTVLLISLGWGLFNYPYYNLILNGPAEQIEKLPKTLETLHSIGIPVAEKTLLEFWMFARPIKSVFVEAFYTFGATYMIFCWYHNRIQRALDILLKVTTVDLVIIAAYGLVDVCYQNGQMWAQNFITMVLPFIHGNVSAKADYYQFHTHLFWGAQNRSIFLEPSYFGIYMAFAFPLLWWNIFRQTNVRKELFLCGLFIVLAFEIFLTQSRTALAVNLCVFVIFALICLYRVQKKLFILLVILGIGYSSAFAGSMEFLKYGQVPSQIGEWTPLATKWQNMQKKEKELNQSVQKKGKELNQSAQKKEKESNKKIPQTSATEYVEHNLKSLSGSGEKGIHAGSNHSRFTVQKTHIQIGLEHPILGVGTSLRQGYLREKLDKDPGGEIQKWNKNIDKWGLLGAGFPNLGDFTLRFAETGFLGLGLYLFPALMLFWQYGKILIRREMEVERISPFIFSALSFVGIMATGLGDGINITFCYWTAMAISFLLLFSKGDNNI
ncbi:MAG: O-antigen ligase family protein [Dialister sp.]|nr:O-antigen ligase family protein [Dialister sp.]MDU5890087.1 O-antigen ligase family protein [Dialister sp.]